MYWRFLSILEMIVGGGKLYHCYFCRIQFHDRRRLPPDPASAA